MIKKLKTRILFYLPIVKILFKRPKYIKYIFSWGRSPLDSEVPWINFDLKEWLDKNLNKEMVVFEYGSGGSTLYYSKKVKKVITVEHDQSWYGVVKGRLDKKNIMNVDICCCPSEKNINNENDTYLSSDKNYEGQNFKRYVEKIKEYPDNYFDLIIVDGRARNSCMNNVLPKIKDGGYILLDNSEREEYGPAINLLDKFDVMIFFGPGFYCNGPWEARVWKIKK